MLIAFLISTIFASISVLAYVSDFIFGKIYFSPVFILSVFSSIYFLTNFIKNSSTKNISVLLPLFFFTALIYFLAPAYPNFYPISLKWDGANHIALTNYLTTYSSHKDMVLNRYSLSFGGQLYSYPWGMHATFAAISKILRLNNFLFIYILMSVIISSIITSTISYLLKIKTSIQAILIIFLLMIFSEPAFFYILKYNHWSQAVGILLILSLVYFMENYIKLSRSWLYLTLLLIAIVFIYPLYAPVAFLGFCLHAFFKKIYGLKKIVTIIAISSLLSLIYVFPTFSDNLARLSMGGGTLNMPFLLRKNMFNIAILFFIPVSICLYLIIKRKLYYYIFPLLTILYALILRICGVNNYWAIKIYGLNVFLFIPILTYGFDFIGNKIKLLFKNNIKLAKNLAFLVALAIFVFPYPKITMVGSKIIHSTILRVKQIKITFEPLKPALSKDEYKMRIWSSRNIADRSIYYPAKGYKIAWCEAVAEKPVIITPPNFRKIVARMNNTTEQFKEYMSEAKKGDFFIVNTLEIKIPKSLFKIKHRQGDLVLLEFTGHIPDNENLALKEKVL